MPGKFESLYCEGVPHSEYSTYGGDFKESLKRGHYENKINVQSICLIPSRGKTGDGGGARGKTGNGGVAFLVKTPFISSRL